MRYCYLWLDHSCLYIQGESTLSAVSTQAEIFTALVSKVIQLADCIFTPIVDSDWSSWTLESPVVDWFTQYCAYSWRGNITKRLQKKARGIFSLISANKRDKDVLVNGKQVSLPYLDSGWSRLEMYYAANLPLQPFTDKSRHLKFSGCIQILFRGGKRPHFLFGSKELHNSATPHVLPHLENASFLRSFHPSEGVFLIEAQRKTIPALMAAVDVYLPVQGYEGERSNGLYHGHGRYTWSNGDIYEGQWYYGRKHGEGISFLSNGSIYEGIYFNDVNEGRGTFKYFNGDVFKSEVDGNRKDGLGLTAFANGSIYFGQYDFNIRQGKGILELANGDSYRGEFQGNKKHGEGTYKYANGDVYVGEFIDDRKHGRGSMKYANKDEYEGEFCRDKKEGKGVYKFSSGSVYSGTFVADEIVGVGVSETPSGDRYEGEFAEGRCHGQGKITYANGEVYEGLFREGVAMKDVTDKIHYPNGDVYEGELRGDCRHGFGHYLYANGDSYIGEWTNGCKNGRGKLTHTDGSYYEGAFVEDEMSGQCKIKHSNGDTFEGTYLNGKKSGFGVSIIAAEGLRYEGDFVDGIWEGRGVLTFSNGDSFEGEFVKGQHHCGLFCYTESGEKYNGSFVDGKKHGKGTYFSKNGDIFEGEYSFGVKQGAGKLMMVEGTQIGTIEGRWEADQLLEGCLLYSNGDTYTGTFQNGRFLQGKFHSAATGDSYTGEWGTSGLKHGHGLASYSSGDVYEGIQFVSIEYCVDCILILHCIIFQR